jgi:hypothetical protein
LQNLLLLMLVLLGELLLKLKKLLLAELLQILDAEFSGKY